MSAPGGLTGVAVRKARGTGPDSGWHSHPVRLGVLGVGAYARRSDRWRVARVDAALVAALVAASLPVAVTDAVRVGASFVDEDRPGAAALVLALAMSVPLLWRRAAPRGVTAVVGAAFLVHAAAGTARSPADLGVLLAFDGLAAYTSTLRPVVVGAAAAAAGLTGLGALTWSSLDDVPSFVSFYPLAVLAPLAVGFSRRRTPGGAGPSGAYDTDAGPVVPPGDGSTAEPSLLSGEVALSPREREVLALLLRGRSNPEIATELGIGRETVKSHVSRVLAKHGVSSRLELIATVRSNPRGASPS